MNADGIKRLWLFAIVTMACLLPREGKAEVRELFRLRIVNDTAGQVAISRDGGVTWEAMGGVRYYTTQVNRKGYTASKWVAPGRVAATAVNAIHISVGYNAEEDRGVVFSLLPKEFLTTPKDYASFLSPDSSIYTDFAAGTGIFGGGEAPFVGNEVFLERPEGMVPLPEDYVPSRGDALVIVVARPARYPSDAIFENWEGGSVTLGYPDGSRELIGTVVRPVRGVGRFAGSVYADVGRIRANHAGVIDISTSPLGRLGAFQIIPLGHAYSAEMTSAWEKTQWMIVEEAKSRGGAKSRSREWGDVETGPEEQQMRASPPSGEEGPPWGGLSPLFYGLIRPDYRAEDLYAEDWEQRLLARFLVDVDLGEGWRPMPVGKLSADASAPLPEWAGEALGEVKRVRVLFPVGEGLGIRD